jgi:hypothetical protein
MRWFWPVRTGETFFDVWSIVHFAVWLIFGANVEALMQTHGRKPLLTVAAYGTGLVFALLWEQFERKVLEPRRIVAFPEVWFNRWISDPLMSPAGAAVGMWLIGRQ